MVVRRCVSAAIVVALLVALTPAVVADDPLPIREIQSNTLDGDASVYDYAVYGDLVDCAGGVVVANLFRTVPRLIVQDPNDPNGWGGIQVKDRFNVGAFDEVEVGDWVSLTNMQVEEYRGTTFLQWYETNNPGLAIESHANALPPPIDVSVSEIPAPLYEPNDPNGWYVENHDAELYESMRVRVRNVTVTAMGLGKESDNYNLQGPGGEDCWAADYLNVGKAPWDKYHPFVAMDREFCAVTGVFEQYTNLSIGYDYYQIITLSSADLAFCGDVDHDGDTDLADLAELLGNYGTATGASYEDGDLDYDGDVDLGDLAEILGNYGTSWI